MSATLVGMISNDGAALLAQLLPVGVLLVVLESRFLAQVPRRKVFPGVYNTPARSWFAIVAFANLVATAVCVYAVCAGVTLDGIPAGFVFVAGALLLGSALNLVLVIGAQPGVAHPAPEHRADDET